MMLSNYVHELLQNVIDVVLFYGFNNWWDGYNQMWQGIVGIGSRGSYAMLLNGPLLELWFLKHSLLYDDVYDEYISLLIYDF